MSKVREETYREEELRRTLEEINRDARGGFREKRSRESKSGRHGDESREKNKERRAEGEDRRRRDRGDDGRRKEPNDDRKQREREKSRPKEGGEERRRQKDEKDEKRRKEDGEERRRHRDDDEKKRYRDDEKRRHRDDEEKRRHRDGDEKKRNKDDEKKRHRDDDEKKRHRDDDEKRRHKGDDEKKRHRDDDEKRRHRDDRDDRRRAKDTGDEKRRYKDDGDRRRDREETEEERERRKREERKRRKEEEEAHQRKDEGAERRRHKEGDDRKRKEREETEEEREKRKKEERRKRKEEEERRRREEEEERLRRELEVAERNRQEKEEEEEEEEDYDDYEDDFEAYDDDFENDSSSAAVNEKNKEMADILRAMSAENDGLSRSRSNRPDSPSSSTSGEVVTTGRPNNASGPKYFINFVSARTRQVDAAVSNRTRQRSRELLRLIHLDSTTYDMFEMGEMEEYQLYMRSFGGIAANQVACQTNEDAMEREVQCEPVDKRTLWTQHPPEDLNAVGLTDPVATRGGSAGSAERSRNFGRHGSLQEQLVEEESSRARETDTRQILSSASLQQSMLIMLRLLEEEARPLVAAPPDSDCRDLSNGYTSFGCPPELRYLPCSFLAFSPSQSNLLVSVHSYGSSGRAGPGEKDVGFALVWNVTAPNEPQDILEAPTRALCARFSPLSATLVFMGLVDGSLAVWDLREPLSWHPVDEKGRRRRAATYTTALFHLEDNHQAPVIDLCGITSVTRPNAPASSFQLASLDAHGVVLLWVTTQLAAADQAGSEADFGLRPGGRVRLSRTVKLQPTPLLVGWRAVRLSDFNSADDCPQQFSLTGAFAPSIESGAFLVGSEMGEVHHIGRSGGRLYPRLFVSDGELCPSPVVSLDLSPFQEPFFVAGYRDGSLRVFHCHHSQPLLIFSDFGATDGLVQVAWSCSRPGVFFALDGAGSLFTWDLTIEERKPVRRERPGGSDSGRRIVRMALSADYSATRRGDRGRRPQIAFSFAGSGEFLEVHEMAEGLGVGDLDETFRVSNLLNSFI